MIRLPSQHSTAGCPSGSTSTATTEPGDTTSGRENMACALLGTTSMVRTSGQTTGPPAENA